MKSAMRKGIRIGLVAGLVVTGLVGVTSLTASGTGDRPMVPYGTLTVNLTDRAGSVTLAVTGGTTFTQALGVATPCSTLLAGPILNSSGGVVSTTANLLNFSAAVSGGSSPNVQLPSSGIGVTDGANCGEPSGLVGPGETLTLALGAYLPETIKISNGTLQIGKSRGSDGDLQVAYDASTSFATIDAATGVRPIVVTTPSGFRSISIGSTATQSSRGLSLRSNTVFDLVTPAPATAPGAPTGVTAVRGNTAATVSWTAPVSDGGAAITGYELQYSTNGGTTWDPNTPQSATSGQPVTGLANGTPYIFQVRAVNTAGTSEWSAPSDPVTPATVPGAPTVSAVRGNAQATVSWTVPSNGGSPLTGYQLRYSSNASAPTPTWTSVPVVPATATTQTVTDLTNGTAYTFEVTAVNAVGSSQAGTANATPATVPVAPTVTAVSSNPAQATVEWNVPADGGSSITGYELRYRPNGGTWTTATTATSPRTVTGLTNGTAYTFEVTAVNAVGSSQPGTATATPWSELVACGDDVIAEGADGDIAKRAAFLRGENAAKTENCVDVGVVVEIVGDSWVYWDNSRVGVDGSPQAVQGTVTIDWAPVSVAKADAPTEIDYDGPGNEGGFSPRLWCPSFSVTDVIVEGKRTVTFDAVLPPYSGPGANTNGTETTDDDTAPWCLVSSSQSLDGSGNVNRTEVFFGSGDPLAKFR